jgi:glycosyltransferase involved in cell wall biosynthesis
MNKLDQQPGETAGRLRVCIDARLTSGGEVGGVQQFVLGLASGLSSLADGNEEYLFLAYAGDDEWLRPFVSGACRIIHGTGATRHPGWTTGLRKFSIVRNVGRKLLAPLLRSERAVAGLPLPSSDGMIERAGVDLVHFPTQAAFLTNVPSIYHPWDLQHLHLPQYFSPEAIRKREKEYRAFCAQAQMVVAATSWQKQDLIEHYELTEEKVRVVEAAPVLDSYPTPTPADLHSVQQKFSLPARFIFYPAQTWAHKNHLQLLEALALLRDKDGQSVPLVCSGKLNDFYPLIERRVHELELEEQVRFLGFVSALELQSLYALARAVIIPTLFEGFGFPLVEAFLAGVPAACSNVTSLPAQAGDAALLFDPHKPEEIAAAARRLWTDDALCAELSKRGRERVSALSWDRTARLFRAHYRRLTKQTLSDEDRKLLSAPPLV